MRKRKKGELVCSAKPQGQVTNMSSRWLDELVEWGMKAVECSTKTSVRARRGVELGLLCERAGHPVKALHVWLRTLKMVQDDNWDLEELPINTRIYSFSGLHAFCEEEELGRHIDRIWRQLGHEELAHYEALAEKNLRQLWIYKYQEPYW